MTLLHGARVLDLTQSTAGMLASRLLGELGAEVVRVETDPSGDRHWQLNNRGKALVVDDPHQTPSESLGGFDVVFVDDGRPTVSVAGPDGSALVVRLTSRCVDPDASLPRSYVLSAVGGLTGLSGDDHPLTPEPVQASQLVALFAATTAVAWMAGGRGARDVEIVGEECVAACLESALPILFGDGLAVRRAPNMHDLVWPASTYQTRNGWVGISSGRIEETTRLLDLLGMQELLRPGVAAFEEILADVPVLEQSLVAAFATWDTDALVTKCQEGGLAVAPALWPSQLLTDEQLLSRKFTGPKVLELGFPFPSIVDGERLRSNGHGGDSNMPARSTDSNLGAPDGARPLHGTRVLDLTWALAGPMATMLLADLGADVVKIESEQHLDSSRCVGPYMGAHDENHSMYHRFFNRQKRSMVCEFTTPGGREMLIDLLGQADVVVENFRAGVLDRKGLGYSQLSAIRPSLVMCSVSGFGRSGLRQHWRSYGAGMAEAHSAIAAANGGDRPITPGRAYADCVAGLYGALTLCAQLFQQRHFGRGSYADLAQFEACAATVEQLALIGPDPAEAHSIEGSDAAGWQVRAPSGQSWDVIDVQDLGDRSLETGFCEQHSNPAGGIDVYTVYPAFVDGGRLSIERPGPILGEHRPSDVKADWEALSASTGRQPHTVIES